MTVAVTACIRFFLILEDEARYLIPLIAGQKNMLKAAQHAKRTPIKNNLLAMKRTMAMYMKIL
jgi:hypothetical protein